MRQTAFPMIPSAVPRFDGVPRPTAWESLEALLDYVHAQESLPLPVSRVLHDVREALDADVVYLFPGLSGDSFELDGVPSLPASWCQQFTLRVLAASPGIDRELARSQLRSLISPDSEYVPSSVAMVRLSRTHSSWMVALSFRPSRVFRATDIRVLSVFRKVLLCHRQNRRAREGWYATLFNLLHCLVTAIDGKDPRTVGRSERVARIAVRLGQEMGLDGVTLSDLYLAGLLHDLGRIGIRDDVLRKSGELTAEELEHVREHPALGERILERIPTLAHLRPAVRHHHEQYDGSGYPDRLAGSAIPLLARVIAVADAADALMWPRPHRDALPREQLEAQLEAGAGTQWDPEVVRAFLDCTRDLYAIAQRGVGESVLRAFRTPPADESSRSPRES